MPRHLDALVRQRLRSPAADQDSDVGQRGVEPLDENTASLTGAGWQIGQAWRR